MPDVGCLLASLRLGKLLHAPQVTRMADGGVQACSMLLAAGDARPPDRRFWPGPGALECILELASYRVVSHMVERASLRLGCGPGTRMRRVAQS